MPTQTHTIGIAGGLGPYAHLDFERKLLDAAKTLVNANSDQTYPEWILSSLPQTPDRTQAIQGNAPDPTPYLLRSLQRLKAAGAAFAAMPCNTAHCYLPQLRKAIDLPILDMIHITVEHIADNIGQGPIGVLATTGTLESNLFANALRAHNLQSISLLDFPNGETLHQQLVMDPIYTPNGIKAKGPTPETTATLTRAFNTLAQKATAIIAACTEIPLALPKSPNTNTPLIDPTQLLAQATIEIAFGMRPMP